MLCVGKKKILICYIEQTKLMINKRIALSPKRLCGTRTDIKTVGITRAQTKEFDETKRKP